ncbi:MAG: helix-turn-helix domain-containing protein [Defluviitaleaceae bacterium]|nr:helix-turn-helix domain-containing protein [Defluviitaleaceae bacterium]
MTKVVEKARLDEVIGKNIRLEREARRLTRDELAEMMELTTSHMGLIERGERGATAVTLSKVSRAFDIPVDHLFSNPQSGGLTIREDDSNGPQSTRKKVQSLITCLNESELNLVVHTIKGIIAMSNSIEVNS